jgi:aliphatic sulfonates family ABC transporter substrate-binding protein
VGRFVAPFPRVTVSSMSKPLDRAQPLGMVFEDPLSRSLLARIERIAASDAPVLVTGETGTGKELVAREVHARSTRADRAFLAVNAGAFSESLIESELFGHEKGAFTGALQAQVGWFEAAHGGTLFLDEIGELPRSLQVKLLRVLSTGEVTRLGSRTPTRVDVRVIAATNVDLLAAMRARRFREDLFYRLSVAGLAILPLRERRGDVLPLARHFLERYAAQLGKPGLRLSPAALDWLERYRFPGNVRELENVIHHAVLVCSGGELDAGDLNCGAHPGSADGPEQQVPGERGAASSSVLSSGARRDETGLDDAALGLRPPCPGPTELDQATAPEGADAAASAIEQLERVLLQLLPLGLPDLHARIESTVLTTTFGYADNNQLETARLLGLSRHVVRARLIEHGQLEGRVRKRAAAAPALEASPASTLRSREVLRVGYQKLGLLMLVKAYGALDIALDSRNVGVAWQEYSGGIQIVEALRDGRLDVGVVGDCPAVFAQSEQVPVVYVAAEPPSPRGAAVLVPRHSTARSMGDLRGKRVAVNRAAQAHYLLMLALEEAGLERGDIELSFEPPERALAAFQSGALDAWAVWDPWLSSARLDLGARVLRDTTGLFESSIYYLARRELAEEHPDLVRELCAQLRTAARWVQSDRGRVAHLAAPGLGFSPRALAASLDRELSATFGVTPTQLRSQQHIADQCLRLQLIPRPVSVADAQWPVGLAG